MNRSYDTTLRRLNEKEWVEIDNKTGREKWKLTELSRTDDAIELRNEARDQIYKILEKRLELKDGETWKWLSNGRWETPPADGGIEAGVDLAARIRVEAVDASSPDLSSIKPGGVYEFRGGFEVLHIIDDQTAVVSYYFNPSIKMWALKGYKTKDLADGDIVRLPEPAKVDGTLRWAGSTIRVIRPLTAEERVVGLELPPSEDELKARVKEKKEATPKAKRASSRKR